MLCWFSTRLGTRGLSRLPEGQSYVPFTLRFPVKMKDFGVFWEMILPLRIPPAQKADTFMMPVSVEITWWTEGHAVWIEISALIGILVANCFLAFFTLQERIEARKERRQAEIARQRSEVTLAGITAVERAMSQEDACNTLWRRDFKHAGFAVEQDLYAELPEYLRRKCDALMDEMKRPIAPEAQTKLRFLLVFRLPYPNFDAVLADVNRLHRGNARTVWDDNGKPIKASAA